MESEHLQKLDVSWGHEPLRLAEARSGARVCDPQRRWFMESRQLNPSARPLYFFGGRSPYRRIMSSL